MAEKTFQFTCPECGVHELNEMTNVLRMFPVVKIGEEELEYGEAIDGHGTLDGIDHYACGNFNCTFIVPDGINTVADLIEWLEKNKS